MKIQLFSSPAILKYHISTGPAPPGVKTLSPEVLEPLEAFHPTTPGVYQFVLCPGLESNRVLFSAHRTAYFSKTVGKHCLEENSLGVDPFPTNKL